MRHLRRGAPTNGRAASATWRGRELPICVNWVDVAEIGRQDRQARALDHRGRDSQDDIIATASQASRTTSGSPRSRSRPWFVTRRVRSRASTFIRSTLRSTWPRIRSRATSRVCSTVPDSNRPPTPSIAASGRQRSPASLAGQPANRRQKPRNSSASRPEAADAGAHPSNSRFAPSGGRCAGGIWRL